MGGRVTDVGGAIAVHVASLAQSACAASTAPAIDVCLGAVPLAVGALIRNAHVGESVAGVAAAISVHLAALVESASSARIGAAAIYVGLSAVLLVVGALT